MKGTTPEALRREVGGLVRDGKIARRVLGEIMVVNELTDRERDTLRRYVTTLGAELVGPAYL